MTNFLYKLNFGAYASLMGFCVTLSGQTSGSGWISTPVVGLFATEDRLQVQPILGVSGASLLGPPVALPAGVTRVYLGPTQDSALVEDTSAAALGLLRFAG